MADSQGIRVRASIAIMQENRILLTPHHKLDGSIIWYMPGGGVNFGETLRQAAERELLEETGYIGIAQDFIHLHETIEPDKPYHGIGVTFSGYIIGGELRAEDHHVYGLKIARWMTKDDLIGLKYDRPEIINPLLGITS